MPATRSWKRQSKSILDNGYASDISHQDGELSYRIPITYQNGAPSDHVNDYFPHLHYQASAVLADEDYDLLIEYWGTRDTDLGDLETESNAIKELSIKGAFDQFADAI